MAVQLANMEEEKYTAGMILSGVGDALGYGRGNWEFCTDGNIIHDELKRIGGLSKLKVNTKEWMVSDDTVMHLATAEAIIEHKQSVDKLKLYQEIANHYIHCMNDMVGRAPGITCKEMCRSLQPDKPPNGLRIPFNTRGGGCGAAMRSMCIGLRFPHDVQVNDLVAISIESGRLTHHHPTGYLGSLAAALFTTYAVQDRPLKEWGKGLLTTLKIAKEYVSNDREALHADSYTIQQNIDHWNYFQTKWEFYLRMRNISDGQSDPIFLPDEEQVKKRDHMYRMLSYDDIGGASGHDAPMIAYDALLACKGNWDDLCYRAMFHGGDSDSTGVIAGCLYGVLYGVDVVHKTNYKGLEYFDRLKNAGKELLHLAKETKVMASTI
ncbi:ADP-ribosylhydrolase ARH1-like [Ruditapes philippinarum]|uniref:ADP-ribosylhydrolase ARH1-like n=1 Tax=Ruditapes philippinarum TaxID=129788 RepID=UPI00295BAC29|nr:ADP-ribosylhydrolase ARH1-like [Ruditapes philippinarum]